MGASTSARPRLGSVTAVLAVSCAWLWCGIGSVVLADEAATRKAEAEALIRGMLQEREKIVSGMVEFKGSKSLSGTEGKPFEGKLSGRLYFDSTSVDCGLTTMWNRWCVSSTRRTCRAWPRT